MSRIQILLVEDSVIDADLTAARLRAAGIEFDLLRVETREAFEAAVGSKCYDLILADYALPAFDGLGALAIARERCPDVPFIFVSGVLGEEVAVETLQKGATDYVLKQRLNRLVPAVRRALELATHRAARARAEQVMRAALETAERANRAKDEFLAVLSHELRTPLSPILATLQTLELTDGLPEAVRESLATVKRNAELEARLIDDLLDLTRMGRGKLLLHPQPTDAHAILESAIDITAPEFKGKGQHLEVELGATNTRVAADSGRLQQVFWNLLRNAAKFTPLGGSVRVRTRDEGDSLVVEVADTGIGFSAEAAGTIFDAFTQADESVRRQYGGLGLGLAIAKSLAEMHGGEIRAHSDGIGKGATFTVRLPALTAAGAASHPNRRQRPGSMKPLRILLVEDHPDTANTMTKLLRIRGHHIRLAHTVSSAVKLGQSEPFDLMISDIGLPDGSGIDVVRSLAGRNFPAIALTGYGTEQDVIRCREAGFAEHLTKPVNLDRLEAAIRAVAAGA